MPRPETDRLLDEIASTLEHMGEPLLARRFLGEQFRSLFAREFKRRLVDYNNRVERYSITPEGEKALEEQDV